MKKVWILEKFNPAEDMHKELDNLKSMRLGIDSNDLEKIEIADHMIEVYRDVIAKNPDGRWYGFEGKTSYKEFCYCAKQALRRHPDGIFRVVEAEILDDAKYWNGYINAEVNEGVYRYLMATK